MLGRKAILLAMVVVVGIGLIGSKAAAWTGVTAESRTDAAADQVAALKPVSLYLVDQAIMVLTQGWPGMSPAERDIFLRLYDPSNSGDVDDQYVAQVLANYQKIRSTLNTQIDVVYVSGSDNCEGQRLYYTDLIRLYVCPYFFEEENELRKARTLIHEIAHISLLVTDRPYYRPTSKKYANLRPKGSSLTQLPLVGPVLREILKEDTLYHPDAYAHYALQGAGYENIYMVGVAKVVVSN